MCGRYTLKTAEEEIAGRFGVEITGQLAPRYNIAPRQQVPVVRLADDGARRELAFARWGLVPSWAKDDSIGNRLINARAETVAQKPAFRAAFKSRRCLIIADGFYEWAQRDGGPKQPYYFYMKDGRVFAFAGLWERWKGTNGGAVESCAIITTTANSVLEPIHDRMPVILHEADYDRWLDPDPRRASDLKDLLVPYPAGEMASHAVSRLVNTPSNEGPRLIEQR
jgi:putative SOS response-associated peptidase YedK